MKKCKQCRRDFMRIDVSDYISGKFEKICREYAPKDSPINLARAVNVLGNLIVNIFEKEILTTSKKEL